MPPRTLLRSLEADCSACFLTAIAAVGRWARGTQSRTRGSTEAGRWRAPPEGLPKHPTLLLE